MEKPLNVVVMKIPPLAPSAAARLEISRLYSDERYVQSIVLGEPAPPEVRDEIREENIRRVKARREHEIAIIQKYNVVQEYLAPLLEDEARALADLSDIQEQIAALRAIESI